MKQGKRKVLRNVKAQAYRHPRFEEVSSPDPEDPSQPKVHLEKQNGHVSRIDVVCPCGRTLSLECVYETPQSRHAD